MWPHGGGVGQAGGLHEDQVQGLFLQGQQGVLKLFDLAGTEDGAVIDLRHLDAQVGQQGAVHSLLAEFVNDQCLPLPGEQMDELVEEGGLAGPQETGDEIELCHRAGPPF